MAPAAGPWLACVALAAMLAGCTACRSVNRAEETPPPQPGELAGKLRAPPGFRVDVYTRDVPNARAMALSPAGTLFVGSRDDGRVYAVVDTDRDNRGDKVHVIASGLNMPAGVDVRDGALYVSALDRVLRFDDIENRLANPPPPVVVSDAFPDDEAHGWKFIRFGPDGWLYVPVGAPCNICRSEDERYASIMRMQPDGSGLEVYAHGVRNTVGFDWDPKTGALWFTDNGRDWLGDENPPDELNRATDKGMHFGYPFCHAGTIADPDFGGQRSCNELVPPMQVLGPHVAALGMRFYNGTQFPERYRNAIFIAEHGSWNRSRPIGYRVTVVELDENRRPKSYQPFIEGWLTGEEAWGRPVDVLVMPDGALLVSDDRAGWIYRVTYQGS
jgi:glucose/arabinose dehydrogenase